MTTILAIDFLETIFKEQKEASLYGKWIPFNAIERLFKKHENSFKIERLGTSEQDRPIYKLEIGTGKMRVLIWSQMHGNEATGTKALFDLFNYFTNTTDIEIKIILAACTLVFIPMLNPDGAEVYTRVNGNNIDLNRDAVDRKAKESKLLRNFLEEFKPQFCFNLHDQRTIFNVAHTVNPASISFLAPSEDIKRTVSVGRKQTMNVIIAMNAMLQQVIPNHIGRYTDAFYPTATGDNFQKLGYNTILIESGHYPQDYVREEVRKYTFFAILQGLFHLSKAINFSSYKDYFKIPNNDVLFYDVIHRFTDVKKDVAFQYMDEIIDHKLVSKLQKVTENDLKNKLGHHEIVFES